MGRLPRLALVPALILLSCPTSARALPIDLSVAVTLRHWEGVYDGLVGTDSPISGFLSAKNLPALEDRIVLEFAVSGESASVAPVYLNFYGIANDPPPTTPLSLYAFAGDGLVAFADFYRTDVFITSISDIPHFPWVGVAAEVTGAYNQAIAEGQPFLGFLLKADGSTRYAISSGGLPGLTAYVCLSNVEGPAPFPPPYVPDPGSTLLLFGMGLAGLSACLWRWQ